jgi:predicted RNA methylase
MTEKNASLQLLAKYPLFRGQLPPTIIDALWHSAFSHKRNPFALCYLPRLVRADNVERDAACEYLKQFGRTREEQARNYYLWAQTVPATLWRHFNMLSLSAFTEIVSDMVPPLAMANLIRHLDLYYYFRDAMVLDLFSGVCGWLMAFEFIPDHYKPRRWVAVDIDARRLQICKATARDLGVDVVTVRRDLSVPYVPHGRVDVVVGSPPCHEFSRAKVSALRDVDSGLALVKSYLESVKAISPSLALMEESATTTEAEDALTRLLTQYGFKHEFFALRDFGAIQANRRRLIAWRMS